MPKFVGAIDVNGAYTLPTADGSADQVLTTDGSGAVTFANAQGGSPGGSNTHIQFNNSDSFGGSANFTFDGTSTVTLASTDAGSSAAPIIELYRNSSSPADADYLGQIKFQGEDDGGAKVLYAKITAKIDDASNTTEDGIIEIAHMKAGSNNISARFTSTALKLINGTGLEVADGLLTLGSTAVTATAAELNIMDGVTSTTAELNILDGVTSTAAELNILDGVTSTAAELNILDGVTSTTAELNILDGVTSTAAELNLVDGITAGTVSASLAVIVDSNKDVTGFRNVTLTGILDAVNFKVNGGQGSDGQVLTSTGSGVAWEDASGGGGGSPGGSNTQIQFNNSSSFGGNANLVYDGSSLVTMTKSGANTGIKLDVASDTEAHSGNIAFYKSEAAGAARLDKDAVYGQIDYYGQTASNGYHHAASIKTLVGEYFYSDNFTPSDIEFSVTPADQTSPIRRLVVRGGSSNTDAGALEVWHNGGANKGGRVDFVDDDGTRLGSFGYANNANFYVDNVVSAANNGNMFIQTMGDMYLKVRDEYEILLGANGLEPYVDSGYKLGSSSKKFSEIHGDAIHIGGTAVTSTAAELNILDGVTSTAAELNILDGVTSTTAELNILDGVTSTAAELNILDGVTSTAAELNLVDGITAGTVAASKAVIVDSNKDISGFRNVTLTGELDAATLDISGDADIDGTTNLDTVQVDGTLTVGVDDTGFDVIFYGATTANGYFWWDESTDSLIVGPAGHLAYGETAPTWPVEFASDDDLTSLTGTAKGTVCIANSQYDASDYSAMDFGYTGTDNPIGRVALRVTGGGSQLEFGTSDNYSNGITQKNLVMLPTGINTFSDGEDLTPDSNWSGQIQINGNGYTSGLAADGDGLWLGTNSASRDVIFATNETERMRVDNNGRLIFKGTSTGSIRCTPSANREILEFRSGGTTLTSGAGYNMYGDGDSSHPSKHIFFCDSSSSELLIQSTGVTISGSLSKGSGSFNIPHPTKGGDWRLRHSFIEGPTADNIYRGTTTISGSSATIDLDTVSGMTDGTWEALNTNPWAMVASSGNAVTWELSGKTLTITGPDGAVCNWMVIGERKDPTMIASDISDSDGKLVVEYEDANYMVTIEEEETEEE